MPVRVERYRQRILDSHLSQDYGLNDDAFSKLETLLQEYSASVKWEDDEREDFGSNARREINALASALEQLPELWQTAFSNLYLNRHLIKAYCELEDTTTEAHSEDVARTTPRLTKMLAIANDLDRLRRAVNTVQSVDHWASPPHPNFGQGRSNEHARDALIRGLDKLGTDINLAAGESRNDFIKGALEIAGLRFKGATLLNLISQSRK